MFPIYKTVSRSMIEGLGGQSLSSLTADLDSEVNNYLMNGYELLGTLQVTGTSLVQVVVKYPPSGSPKTK